MTGLVLGTMIVLGWFGAGLWFARREYERVFAAKVGERMAKVYGGGKFSREQAHADARQAAYVMLAFWWAAMPYRLIDRMLTGPQPVANPFEFMAEEPVPEVDLTSDLDRLLAAEERRQKPDPNTDRRMELIRRFDGLYQEFHAETDPHRRECIMNSARMVTDEIRSLGYFVDGMPPEYRDWVIRKNVRNMPEPCPCGYTTECHIHCGDGHKNGMCPTRHTHRLSKILANPE